MKKNINRRRFLSSAAALAAYAKLKEANAFGLGNLGFGKLGASAQGGGSSGPVTQPLRSAVSRAQVPNGFASGMSATWIQGQSRCRMFLGGADLTELRVVYGNWGGQDETAGPGNLVLEAAIEGDSPIGVVQCKWSGATSITIAPGATVISDPIFPADLGLTVFPANSMLWFRTGVTAVSNLGFPFGTLLSAVTGSGESYWAGPAFTSQVNATGPMTTPSGGGAATAMITPFAVLGRYTVEMPTIACLGDSITEGINDTAMTQAQGVQAGNGYIGRSAYGSTGNSIYPTLRLGIGGEGASSNYTQRATLFQYATHGLVQYGSNDLTGGQAPATILANLKTIWNLMASSGISHIWQALVVPRTSSTDAWLTEANQTPITNFGPGGNRDILNAAIVAAIGTNNLTGVLDFSSVCAGTDPTKWKTNSTTYAPAVTVTSGTKAVTFDTGTFTAADVGGRITITGAGAAAATLLSTINAVASTTSITLADNAGTTLSASTQTVTYGQTATGDGIHPGAATHALMAPFLTTARNSAGQQMPAVDTSWVPTGADWAMDFKNGRYFGVNPYAMVLYPLVSANNGIKNTSGGYGVTANDSTGKLIQFAPNTARVTPGRGLLAEKTSTNLAASPFAPATQTVTLVNATQYTASITGPGSMVLSGAATGTVTAGSPVTFTSSGTSLVCTISGSPLSMQIETGAVATSPISGTRAVEDIGWNQNLMLSANNGTIVVAVEGIPAAGTPIFAAGSANYLNAATTTTTNTNRTATLTATDGPSANGHKVYGEAWDGTGRGICTNGGAIASDANSPGILTNSQIYLVGKGTSGGSSFLNGYVQSVVHYPQRLTGATTPTFQQATTP